MYKFDHVGDYCIGVIEGNEECRINVLGIEYTPGNALLFYGSEIDRVGLECAFADDIIEAVEIAEKLSSGELLAPLDFKLAIAESQSKELETIRKEKPLSTNNSTAQNSEKLKN